MYIKVVTAIGNRYLNEELKKYVEIVSKDIQYQDGVFEILQEKNNIDLVLLSTEILGEYDFQKFIEEILKINGNIEIVIFSNYINKIDYNFLNSKKIYKVYINNEIGYCEYIDSINVTKDNETEKIKKEIKLLKEDISLSQNVKSYINKNFMDNKEFIDNEKIKFAKIITIVGAYGVGKTIFSAIFSKFLDETNKKVLLIDCDINNFGLRTLFCKFKKEEQEIKINKNIDFYYFFNKYEKFKELESHIKDVKEKYDMIIIDTMTNINEENELLKISDFIFFIIEPNLLGIKKAKILEEIYLYDWNIKDEKIKIIFNMVNKYSIDNNILFELFDKYEILGTIKYNDQYNLFVNKNTIYRLDMNEYKKIYEKIEEE